MNVSSTVVNVVVTPIFPASYGPRYCVRPFWLQFANVEVLDTHLVLEKLKKRHLDNRRRLLYWHSKLFLHGTLLKRYEFT